MGIVETSIKESSNKRDELLFWAGVLGFEVNELLNEMPQLREIIESVKQAKQQKD